MVDESMQGKQIQISCEIHNDRANLSYFVFQREDGSTISQIAGINGNIIIPEETNSIVFQVQLNNQSYYNGYMRVKEIYEEEIK